jgi:hypothetical protein
LEYIIICLEENTLVGRGASNKNRNTLEESTGVKGLFCSVPLGGDIAATRIFILIAGETGKTFGTV